MLILKNRYDKGKIHQINDLCIMCKKEKASINMLFDKSIDGSSGLSILLCDECAVNLSEALDKIVSTESVDAITISE